jgi:hypothetical protein
MAAISASSRSVPGTRKHTGARRKTHS